MLQSLKLLRSHKSARQLEQDGGAIPIASALSSLCGCFVISVYKFSTIQPETGIGLKILKIAFDKISVDNLKIVQTAQKLDG